jgi:hypothetical protein
VITQLRNRLAALERRVQEIRSTVPPFVIEVEDEAGEVRAAELYTIEHGVARTLHGEQAAEAWHARCANELRVPNRIEP